MNPAPRGEDGPLYSYPYTHFTPLNKTGLLVPHAAHMLLTPFTIFCFKHVFPMDALVMTPFGGLIDPEAQCMRCTMPGRSIANVAGQAPHISQALLRDEQIGWFYHGQFVENTPIGGLTKPQKGDLPAPFIVGFFAPDSEVTGLGI